MRSGFCNALIWSTLIAAGTAAAAVLNTASTSSGAADTGTLQEVVVTARRFSEDLQNVPLAVTALSAATRKASASTGVRAIKD